MKWLMITGLLLVSALSYGQDKEEQKIKDLLNQQSASWNKGDIEGFMQTYWNSDSLLFIGKSGVQHGWKKTLDNYKKGYADKAAMGILTFTLIEVKRLSPDYFYVVGKWMLNREAGNLNGHFDLLIRRFGKQWFIISDHSS